MSLCPPLSLSAHETLAQGETCRGSERKQWASQPAQKGAHAWRHLSCTVLGCRSCPSVLTPSKDSPNAHRFFDLSKGFTVHSFWWLGFISFLSAQCASCLLHPFLVHQAGILEELCVVLASYWSTLAPGEIEVWKKKCVCVEWDLFFLITKMSGKMKFGKEMPAKATHHLNSQKGNGWGAQNNMWESIRSGKCTITVFRPDMFEKLKLTISSAILFCPVR